MIENFTTFRNFSTLTQAKEVEALLNKSNIETILADNIGPVDVSFSGSTLLNQYEIKIDPSNFKKAQAIVEKDIENALDDIDPDYHLLSYTDEELYEVILNSDEWSIFDYKLAQKLLTNRGKAIDPEMLASLKKQRLKILAKPEENQKPWIIAGYIFSLLGGGIGIVIGYSLWTFKKALPNGERIYSYSPDDRTHGKTICIIGLIVLPMLIIIEVLNLF